MASAWPKQCRHKELLQGSKPRTVIGLIELGVGRGTRSPLGPDVVVLLICHQSYQARQLDLDVLGVSPHTPAFGL